jgi:hypothetical protein
MKTALSLAVLMFVLLFHGQNKPAVRSDRKSAASTLKIVNDQLIKVDDSDCRGCLYAVKGSIYNPNADGVKNVVIRYYIWKKFMGKDGHGAALKSSGGLILATIKYLPPKQTVEFTAFGPSAPVMTLQSGLLPEPITAEITAEWDDDQ